MPRPAPYGFQRGQYGIYIPLPAGTGAAEIVTDYLPAFHHRIERVGAFVAVVGTGAGATRTLRVVKGASTVVWSATVTLASTDTLGEAQVGTLVPADAEIGDNDLLTVDFTAGGVAFTGGALNLIVQYRAALQRSA